MTRDVFKTIIRDSLLKAQEASTLDQAVEQVLAAVLAEKFTALKFAPREAPRPKLLLVSDFAVHSGFARVGENVAQGLQKLGWEIEVIGLNYQGAPHPLQGSGSGQFRIHAPSLGGDGFGVGVLRELVPRYQPDVILIINDPWICPVYLDALLFQDKEERPAVVLYMPVDSPGLHGRYVSLLNRATVPVAYTRFGRSELAKAGLLVGCQVIPHGIDLETFQPVPKAEARQMFGIDPEDYIVLVNDRNQPRKRLDLALASFAYWVKRYNLPPNVKLFYHGFLQDIGWDLEHLGREFGILERLIFTDHHQAAFAGLPEKDLKYVYSLADARLTTSMGEGWGLLTMEAMACGVPNVVPHWGAYVEWPQGAVEYVPVSSHMASWSRVNTIGGIVAPAGVATALERLYRNPAHREDLARRGLALVQQDRFRWQGISRQFHEACLEARGREELRLAEIKAAREKAEAEKAAQEKAQADPAQEDLAAAPQVAPQPAAV